MTAAPSVAEQTPVFVERIRNLPTLPEVYSSLVVTLDDPTSSVGDVEQIIRQDPAVTANLLRLANSPVYGRRSSVSTVAQAVRTIGYEILKQFVLTTSVMHLFRPSQNSSLSYKAYWNHSLSTAVAARHLALCIGEEHPEEFFVAGLLHDIGILIHDQYLPEQFRAAVTLAAAERLPLTTAEHMIVGFSHDQTGALLLHRWHLASQIQRAVAYHHTPTVNDNGPLTLHEHVVHCADIISCALGFIFTSSEQLPPFVSLAWDVLRLSPGHLAEIVVTTKSESLQLIKVLFGSDGS